MGVSTRNGYSFEYTFKKKCKKKPFASSRRPLILGNNPRREEVMMFLTVREKARKLKY